MHETIILNSYFTMKLNIPQSILEIIKKFEQEGFEIYLVGGSVRNMLLSKPVKDWDLTTNATPEDVLKLFPEGFYDNTFGTVGVPLKGESVKRQASSEENIEESKSLNGLPLTVNANQIVEVTTFRTEKDYRDGRHPTEVTWGQTIEEDLERRDFTMNAIALKVARNYRIRN